MATSLTSEDLETLLTSWELALSAERKSPQTIKSYGDGIRGYIRWCQETSREADLSRDSVRAFVNHLLDAGAAPATAKSRQLALRRLSAWLLEEDEIPADALAGMKPPKIDKTIIDPLTDDQLRALIKACAGTDLRDRRDEAIVRFMFETGARAGEVVALTLDDLDLKAGTAIIRRGKGGKGRIVPFGSETGLAIDRYIRRARSRHSRASSPALWLGERGRGFTYGALNRTLKLRAERAGIANFHPHRMRHTAAHRWLAAGGSEGGLMTVAGWSSPDMLMRYTAARAADRANAEAKGLNLGEL
ncbi:MAG: tyrosine-type recombinase/integrase [Aeromicrobium sp.]